MPGFKLLTALDPPTCLKIAWRTAQNLGYELTPIDDHSRRFTATRGSLVGALFGGLFAPRHILQISVASYPDANEIVVERNEPWLSSGAIGVSKVKRAAEELVNAIARAVEAAGSTIVERREF